VLLGVFVTSFYSFRLLYLTFFGKERFREAHAHDAHGHDAHAHDAHRCRPRITTTTAMAMARTSRTSRRGW
jgi:NADH:ubiquinone oxidoreductase subunit 5 (subunit L)/multisubunit Na+/H+ antiporter MnhA subunit